MKIRKTILWVMAVLILVAATTGIYLFNKKVPGLEHIEAEYALTADELYDEFQASETEALTKYRNKVISVTGEVISVINSGEGSNVMLQAENALANGINCSFKHQIDHISKGQNITIKGRCQGILMDVVLNNCYAE